jgi:prepilin-type N-terminal cleavage/methylation domain-containing protein
MRSRSSQPGRPAGSARGFTLLEVAIALAILSVALLLGMSLLLGQARIVHRLDADRAARAALAGTLEAIRSGVLPLRPGHFAGGDLAALGAGAPPDGTTGLAPDLSIDLDVTAAAPPGLFEVVLRARYRVAGQGFTRRLGSMVWQPAVAAPP